MNGLFARACFFRYLAGWLAAVLFLFLGFGFGVWVLGFGFWVLGLGFGFWVLEREREGVGKVIDR